MRIFCQDQGNQGVARRLPSVSPFEERGTGGFFLKEFWPLGSLRLAKMIMYGWKLPEKPVHFF
jgi:hypothetical protein